MPLWPLLSSMFNILLREYQSSAYTVYTYPAIRASRPWKIQLRQTMGQDKAVLSIGFTIHVSLFCPKQRLPKIECRV